MQRDTAGSVHRGRMNIVIGGHVDHGKSTIVGRLLADTRSLPEGRIEQVRALCARTSKPFEYAFLLDALKDERAQGITIDAARVFFRTPARDYIIIDAPGHIECLKNMITGAARADAALLVIDAREGVQENSRRHGYMMAMLGIAHLAVIVNKMDLVAFDREVFAAIEAEYRGFLDRIGVRTAAFIPAAGRDGDQIARRSARLAWHEGPTVLEALEAFPAVGAEADRPFRLPVQDVYKFTSRGDDRRIVAGAVEAGSARAGDEVVFYPSGKRGVIKSFEAFNRPSPAAVGAGEAAGFTLREQIYIARGELAALAGEPRPHISSRLKASVFWLGRSPLLRAKDYLLKIGTARTGMRVEAIHRVINAASLETTENPERVERHDVAECTLACHRAIAFDTADVVPATSRFVVVDGYEIAGGGTVLAALPDRQVAARERVLVREDKWEPSFIAPDQRAARFDQRPTLLLITGAMDADRKGLAKRLEARLFEEGRLVYFIGMANMVYGVDADLARDAASRHEHLRRLAEVANLMLDAGLILIVSTQALTPEELDLIRTTVDPDRIQTVWIGDRPAPGLACDLALSPDDGGANVDRLRTLLVEKGVLR